MKYFTIKELCKSSTADRLGIDNSPNSEVISNLKKLVEFILDPLREKYGKPIYVNGGYRCPALNKAVNGSKTSQHMQGLAVDITTRSIAGNKIIRFSSYLFQFTKFFSIERPTRLDFSGWNCAACTLSFPTAAVSIVPYSVCAVTIDVSFGTA